MTPEDLAALPPERLPFPITRAVSEPIEARSDGGMPTMVAVCGSLVTSVTSTLTVE